MTKKILILFCFLALSLTGIAQEDSTMSDEEFWNSIHNTLGELATSLSAEKSSLKNCRQDSVTYHNDLILHRYFTVYPKKIKKKKEQFESEMKKALIAFYKNKSYMEVFNTVNVWHRFHFLDNKGKPFSVITIKPEDFK